MLLKVAPTHRMGSSALNTLLITYFCYAGCCGIKYRFSTVILLSGKFKLSLWIFIYFFILVLSFYLEGFEKHVLSI